MSEAENLLEQLIQSMTYDSNNQHQNISSFQAPIKGDYHNIGIFSPTSPTDARHKKHEGVDLLAPGGTAVYPIEAGVVTNVGSSGVGGNFVVVQHANGVKSYYAHLGTISVHKNDKVELNSQLGTIGNSGNAKDTFPHLHFQVWTNGKLQNPGGFFHVPEYSKTLPKNYQAWASEEAKQKSKNFSLNKK